MLRRKSQLQGDAVKPQANRVTLERARLMQARTLALRRNDKTEVAMLDSQLAELAVESPPVSSEPTEGSSALLAKVNERNRKANQEAIRRAELQEVERKRRERRLGTPNVVDPSARLRTVPRMFASRYGFPSRCQPSKCSPIEIETCLRSGLPRQILADRLRPSHRSPRRPQSTVRPRLTLGKAISMRAFSMPSRLIWATSDVTLLISPSWLSPCCAIYM
jgi:RNA polymerase-associated protein RTF1